MSEHLDAYKEGWRRADPDMILQALADDFVYDDPIEGRFTKADFGAYLRATFATETSSGGIDDEGFETVSESVTQETDGEVTAWNWFVTSDGEGAALVKARPDGVYLERLAYYSRSEAW